jgi:hypothetical protein
MYGTRVRVTHNSIQLFVNRAYRCLDLGHRETSRLTRVLPAVESTILPNLTPVAFWARD